LLQIFILCLLGSGDPRHHRLQVGHLGHGHHPPPGVNFMNLHFEQKVFGLFGQKVFGLFGQRVFKHFSQKKNLDISAQKVFGHIFIKWLLRHFYSSDKLLGVNVTT
jgi:hypothetical protein